MIETTVVHVNDPDGFDIYIGRAMPQAKNPRCHVQSQWANPFTVARYGREDSLAMYERAWRLHLTGPGAEFWCRALRNLEGKRIACWCKRKDREVPCHGDILVKLLKELEDNNDD